MSGGSTSEEFVLIADLRCSSSAVYVVPIKLRKFCLLRRRWRRGGPHAESAVSLAGLASQLKPALPTLALGNVTNAPRSRRLHVGTLNDALTSFWHHFNQRGDAIELGLKLESS